MSLAAEDVRFMAMALRIAERGLYTTHPNPRVGSIIVKHGEVVGRGFHLQAGAGHAEANALREARDRASGATVYCTLEPCSFHGRTPACATALVQAGVARVVVAMEDPHPRNAGRGLDILRDAGIEVVSPLLESSARQLNPGHLSKFETGRPYVRVKLGMSLDARTALANGISQWITGDAARRDVQRLRARSSAIVTGVATVIDDDPSLTVRAVELDVDEAELAATIARHVVVLDSHQRIPPGAKVLGNPNLLLACVADTRPELDCNKVVLPANEQGRVDLSALLVHLASMDCNEVLFECGPTLAGALISEGLADELIVYMAPVVLGSDARSLLNIAKIDSMQDRMELDVVDVRHIGTDVRLTLLPKQR